MRTALLFESFRSKWLSALSLPGERGQLWEGQAAVAELRAAGYLDLVLFRSETRRPTWMLLAVFREVQDYRIQRMAWKEFENVRTFLARTVRDVRREAANEVRYPALKRVLTKLARTIDRERQRVHLRMTGSHLGVWERLWPEHPRRVDIHRRMDLDARLQLQAAKAFRTFLRLDNGVSLRTIARLVVLTYMICGLATERGGLLRIVGPERTISVRSVLEKLRRRDIREITY